MFKGSFQTFCRHWTCCQRCSVKRNRWLFPSTPDETVSSFHPWVGGALVAAQLGLTSFAVCAKMHLLNHSSTFSATYKDFKTLSRGKQKCIHYAWCNVCKFPDEKIRTVACTASQLPTTFTLLFPNNETQVNGCRR